MKNKIIKKFIVLFSLSFVLFGFNFAMAVDAPAPVAINLKVYSGSTVLFNGPLTVTACPESLVDGAPITVSGRCALEQSGLSPVWIWYDSNFHKDGDLPKTIGFLDGLGGSTSDPNKNLYWGWFSNLNYGTTSLNSHILSSNEELLFTYNSFPLRISASKNSGTIGDAITFTAEEKSTFNGDWSDMLWTKSPDTTITLGTQSCTTILDGTCFIVLDKAGVINAIGNKALYVPSNNLNIEVSEPVHHSSSGSYIIKQPIIEEKIKEKTFSLENALKFLTTNQKSDGSYGAPMYTDWVAIGATAVEDSNLKLSLTNYFKTNSFDSSVLTDNERHAMALMSLGINPYFGTSVNYIKKITNSFDGTQFGDSSLINDDIFALVVLKNAGYNGSDGIITKDVNYIISKQDKGGSWGSVDMTSASIQALRGFENIKGVPETITKSTNYLISNQETDGGFGNSFSASWALQAISENSAFSTQIAKAGNYLASKQQLDGGLENITDNIDTRIWATAYAIPAILHKPWSEILKVSPRQGLGEEKVGEVKKINKEIIKKSAKTLEDRAKIENNNLPQNNKIQSETSHLWDILKVPFRWLWDKLSF